jgi:RimJ/RimL family protein N-acetyltransferase
MIEVRDAKPDDLPEANELLSIGIASGGRVAIDENGVICAWGLYETNLLSDECFVWMEPRRVEAYSKRFLRECRRYIADIRPRYKRLVGSCEAANTKAVRWMKWMGFEPTGEFEYEGRRYVRMEICDGD